MLVYGTQRRPRKVVRNLGDGVAHAVTPTMTAEELADFIERRMSMSHIYQPLIVRPLLDADGTATLRQLAMALVSASEPALVEAESAIKGLPVQVLRKHGVIA